VAMNPIIKFTTFGLLAVSWRSACGRPRGRSGHVAAVFFALSTVFVWRLLGCGSPGA
jgi:hypothetical protein